MRTCHACGQAKPRGEYYPEDLSKRPNGDCRSCRIAAATAANQANPNRQANVRRYNQGPKGKATQKRFDERQPGKRKTYVELHYEKHPERLAWKRKRGREYMAAKYHADPETAKRKTAEYLKRYPELKIAKDARHRARKVNAPGTHTSDDLRAIWDRQKGRCANCGVQCHWGRFKGLRYGAEWTIDHIIPLVRGGSNWPANLRGLCRSCNAAKRDRLEAE